MGNGMLDGPLRLISAPDCPVSVAAVRLRAVQPEDDTLRFASGWGVTPEEAARGCLLEAAERTSVQLFGTEPIRRARLRELCAGAVPPPEILLVGDEQYRQRRRWNARHAGLNEVPPRWRADRAIDWIATAAGFSSEEAWLPAGLCYLGHGRDRKAGLAPANSSGVAAGDTLENAAVRAFLELVERDAVAIWWYNRIPRPKLAPERLDEPLVAAYADWSSARDRVLRLHDLTHDFDIPVVAAVSHDRNGSAIALGFGAGFFLGQAAAHAVGELGQCECNLALISERAERQGLHGITPEAKALLGWAQSARLEEHPHLLGGPVRGPDRAVVALDLAKCHQLCRRHGLRFLALDLTRPGIGVPVARVVVPGLRPIWARFAPGRLYEVPVKLGWLSRPLAPEALNPVPLMV